MKAAAVDTHMHTHTQAQAHPQSQLPTVQTAGDCNKAPLFLRSIKQNSKDLCESLRVCECVCVWLKGRQRPFTRHSHTESTGHETQDKGHRTQDKGH